MLPSRPAGVARSSLMTPDHARRDAWTIIIPVKDTRVAKTRLARFSQSARARLALAFALDSATAAVDCPDVRRVVAVTNDAEAARALEAVGVHVVADAPDAGLNAALIHAVASIRRGDLGVAVAAMSADLPSLRSVDLSTAFDAGIAAPYWFVADDDGLGTTLLAAAPGIALSPGFGVGSRDRHARSGAREIAGPELARLRRDVDTEEHLRAAVRLGVGHHTSTALDDLEVRLGPPEVA